jgi:putative transposase
VNRRADRRQVAELAAPDLPLPDAARRPLRELMDDRLLDALLERSRDQAGGLRLTGEGSMLGELVRAVLERALESELTAHLGYEKGGRGGAGGNARNGNIAKTVQTGVGPVPLQVPRDRAGTFEPVLVPKRAGRVAGGLDDMVISLYAHGMSVRDIIHHLRQVYGTELSPETVSRITCTATWPANALTGWSGRGRRTSHGAPWSTGRGSR